MDALNLFVGYDNREAIGTHTFVASLLKYASRPVPVTILDKEGLERSNSAVNEGTNAFTLSRFLAPYYQGWKGTVVFADGADMLLRDDLYKLWDLHNPACAVQVVNHNYKTINPRKYVGTLMEADNLDYERKNWASFMLINCYHYAWRQITPAYINDAGAMHMLQFKFLQDKHISYLPVEWNWLVDEYGGNHDAKLLHWTCGVPGFPRYHSAEHAQEWFESYRAVNYLTS